MATGPATGPRYHGFGWEQSRWIVKTRLLQNCFADWQLDLPIPGFEVFDFRRNPRPEWREFEVFRSVYEDGLHRSADLVGVVSSRFSAKTRLSGHDVRRWIDGHPGKSVYFVHPWPQWSYSGFSVMSRFAHIHGSEAFLPAFQRVLDLAGIPLDFLHPTRDHNRNHGLSSYWFGNARFWDGIMTDLVLPILRLSRAELGSELHDLLYRPFPYYGLSAHRAGGLPFLLERATVLYVKAQWLDEAAFYPRTRQQILDACVFPFERDLVQAFGDEVDAWDAAGCYDRRAMEYFDTACRHTSFGWLSHLRMHPVDFDHGDPRPHLPWFRRPEVGELSDREPEPVQSCRA